MSYKGALLLLAILCVVGFCWIYYDSTIMKTIILYNVTSRDDNTLYVRHSSNHSNHSNVSMNIILHNEYNEYQDVEMSVLEQLELIDIKDQIDRMNQVYNKIFNDTSALINIVNITSNINKCIILTPIVIGPYRNKYNMSRMKYAYLSKLKYARFHSYLFVIDTFDYLNYLNVARYINYGTPSQNYTTEITPHWNKVLSLLYWSKYANCILNTDDDAFIGNYNLSIKYWLNVANRNKNKISKTFLVLPYEIGAPKDTSFSNYAFILYDYKYKDIKYYKNSKITTFLLNWWNNKNIPSTFWGDQDRMYHTILDYVYYYNDMNNNNYTFLLKQCRSYCRIQIPLDRGCIDRCYQQIGFRRPTKMDIINQNYNLSVFWTPVILSSFNHLLKYGNLDEYQYDIYPFSINLHWAPSIYRCFNDTSSNQQSIIADKLHFVFDKTYLLHFRYKLWMKNVRHHVIFQNAINKMKIFTLLEKSQYRSNSTVNRFVVNR